MSEYGPAFFVKRKDENEISEEEQAKLLGLIKTIAQELDLKDSDGDPVEPGFYNYDEYEDKSAAFLIFTSFEWGMMPDAIKIDQEEEDVKELSKIGIELDKIAPDTYEYLCYYVEG